MSDEISRDKSPNCPKITLEAAIGRIKDLHSKIGKAKVKREVAAGALGYSGLTGGSLTLIGSLNQYGLIEQDRASGLSVSPLAIRILHPNGPQQEREEKVVAALNPKVFNGLYTEGFQHCDESVLTNHLIQNNFTPETAKKVASVFLSNIAFTNLNNDGKKIQSDTKKDEIKADLDTAETDPAGKVINPEARMTGGSAFNAKQTILTTKTDKIVLAQYSIPIGASEATITFTGEKLTVEDFDALADYVAIFKKQFERKQKTEASENLHSNVAALMSPPKRKVPKHAYWTHDQIRQQVNIVAFVGERDGENIYRTSDGNEVPLSQLSEIGY